MTDSTLMKAILSMDAYNRGYNSGINFGIDPSTTCITLGTAQTISDRGETNAQDIGFYAIAYDYNGETVISFRGTDHDGNSYYNDIYYGYGIGAGYSNQEQGNMAIDFYKTVDAATSGDISVTGHSLGGGLAGLVGGLYGLNGELFDAMAFEDATQDTYDKSTGTSPNTSLKTLVYGSSTPWSPDYSGLNNTSLDAEALSSPWVPGNSTNNPNTTNNQLSLGNDVDLDGIDALAQHNISTLVIRMYSSSQTGFGWDTSAKYFWPVLYDDGFAQSLGAGSVSGQLATDDKYAEILRTAIAYSAIDDGLDTVAVRPFGDTGIVALYHDANVLGTALAATGAPTMLASYAEEISKAFVNYAGDLALNKILQSNIATAVDGVLSTVNTTNDHVLCIDFSVDKWQMGLTSLPSMEGRESLFEHILVSSTALSAIQTAMYGMWTNNTVSVFDRASFNLNTGSDASIIDSSDLATGKAQLYFGNETSETFAVGDGNNLIVGSLGTDTADYSGASATTFSIGENLITAQKGSSGVDGTDILVQIEKINSVNSNTDTYNIAALTGLHIQADASDLVDYSSLATALKICLPYGGGFTIANNNGSGATDVVEYGSVKTSSAEDFVVIGGDTSQVSVEVNNGVLHEIGSLYSSYSVDLNGGTNNYLLSSNASISFDGSTGTDSVHFADRAGDVLHFTTDVTGLHVGVIVENSTYGDTRSVFFDHDGYGGNATVDYIELGGSKFSAAQIVAMNDFSGSYYNIGSSDWYHLVQDNSSGAYAPNIVETNPTTGAIEGMRVDPVVGGMWGNKDYVDEIYHPWVITAVNSPAPSHVTLSFDTMVKDIVFKDGISESDVRFTSDGYGGLDIHLDSESYSFHVSNFEDGKTLTGFIADDQSWWSDLTAAAHSASITSTGTGAFSGAYETDESYSTATDSVTWYLEHIKFAGSSTVIDMQAANLELKGTDAYVEYMHGFDSRDDVIHGMGGYDYLYGYGGNDTLYGDAGDDIVYGGAGNDTLNGGTGTDDLYGGTGNDTYVFYSGDSPYTYANERIFENTGEGTDTIVLHGIDTSDVKICSMSYGTMVIQYGADDKFFVYQSYGTDGQMVGDKVESIHFDDSTVWDLTGGLHIQNVGTNTGLYGTDYADTIEGNTNSESLYGFGGNDTISSGGGYDYLYGGAGDDTLISTDGNSHMYGGDGADTFAIQSMNGSDYVLDFSATDGDVIDIHSVLSGYDPVNDTLSDFVQISEVSGNSFLSVDQDGTGTTYSMTQIAVISGVTGITNVDDLVTNGHLLVTA